MHERADNFLLGGPPQPGDQAAAIAPPIDADAQRAIDQLSEQIQEVLGTAETPTFLKRLFCQTLDWGYVNQPVPGDVLPESCRADVVEATIVARHEELRLCYVRLAKSELLAKDERRPMERLAKAWPSVLVAFGNFGQNQIDFCQAKLDGGFVRFSLDRSLFGASELAQAIYAMRAFELKTEERAPQLEVAQRMERQLKRLPRRLRRRRGLDRDPFWRELGRHKLLSLSEEQRLRRAYESGGRSSARDKLVLSNLRLVVSIAYRYRRQGVIWDDLLQEGVCGLLRAADKYEPERGCRFSTYATWWIMQSVTRAIAEQAPFVTTPSYWAQHLHRFRRFWKEFLQENGFRPSDRDLQDYFELSPDELQVLRQVLAARYRRCQITDAVPCVRAGDPSEHSATADRRRTVASVLRKRLDARSADVLRRRYGFAGQPEETLEEIGQSYGVTRERVRQIESKALAILQHPPLMRRLEPYVT